MQYKSPIKVLSPFLLKTESLEKIDFVILKKRILAEFELSNKPTIKSKYGELSKNDFIQLIESLESAGNYKYHLIILKHKQLLTLLEHNRIEKKTFFNEAYFEDLGFVEFLSPYFAHSLGAYLASCLSKKCYYHPIYFRKNFPVTIQHEHFIIEQVSEALETLVAQVEAIQSKHLTKKLVNRAVKYFSPDLILLINSLPKRLFINAPDIYAQCGMYFVFKYLQRGEKKYASLNKIRDLINLLRQLDVNKEVKVKFENEFNKYHSIIDKNSSKVVLVRIFLFFLAFMFLLRIIVMIVDFVK